MKPLKYGIFLCIVSQILFSILYLFSHWMKPLSGNDVFALRMVVMALGVWTMLLAGGHGAPMRHLLTEQLGRHPQRWLLMLLGTALFGSQLWLFMWAPVNGEGVNAAMGYFIFPLTMTLAGRLLLNERLSRLQQAALMLAALGVAHELWQTHAVSWSTLWVCLMYPPYYLLRRQTGIPALSGICFDLTLLGTLAAAYLLWQQDTLAIVSQQPRYWLLLPALGLFSAVSMWANLKSSALLPVNLFGMLSYLEPALLFLAAVWILRTPVSPSAYLTYTLIWSGLLLLALNGWHSLQHGKRRQTA